MTSILTNGAALAALSTLRSINENMETVQKRISSGYRVETASDNAAYWSIATTMRSDKGALAATEDALGLAAAKADTSYAGLNQSLELMKLIKNKLVVASDPGVSKQKINEELIELKAQLVTASQAASFSGENWLYNSATSAPGIKEMVGAFTRNPDGTVSVQTITFDTAKSVLVDKSQASRGLLTKIFSVTPTPGATGTANYYLLNVSSTTGAGTGTEIILYSTSTSTDVNGMLLAVEAMLNQLTDTVATLGATQSRINQQHEFVINLVSTIEKGVGRLVDADMNEESTRLKALQTQQQLGIQALSIANADAANIMQLFRQ